MKRMSVSGNEAGRENNEQGSLLMTQSRHDHIEAMYLQCASHLARVRELHAQKHSFRIQVARQADSNCQADSRAERGTQPR